MKYKVLNGPPALQKGVELETIPSLGSIIPFPCHVAKVLQLMGVDPAQFELVVAYLDKDRTTIAVTQRICRSQKAPVELDLHSGAVSCVHCGSCETIRVVHTTQAGHAVIDLPATLQQADAFVLKHAECQQQIIYLRLAKSKLN